MGEGIKILVVADDLTGAAEIGGIALRFGLSSRILLGSDDPLKYHEEVLIIDTDSRNLSPLQAQEKLERTALMVEKSSFSLIYKKVDSLFRGHVLSELIGFAGGLDYSTSTLVPANPSKGRKIISGKYFVNNILLSQTEFRDDPEYPRLTDSVKEMVFGGYSVLYQEETDNRELFENIFIPDVETDEDLSEIAISADYNKCLAAGGGDFFSSLLKSVLNLEMSASENLQGKNAKHCFFIGSFSYSSKRTKAILKKEGFSCITVDAPPTGSSLKMLEKLVTKKAEDGDNLLITLPEEKISDTSSAEKYHTKLIRLAGFIIGRYRSKYRFYIEGGRTASVICRLMGWNSLEVLSSSETGTAGLSPDNTGIEILIKPGSYNWPESVFNGLRKQQN
jgi:uncharacterized protein YgbK (DUF1537 family)